MNSCEVVVGEGGSLDGFVVGVGSNYLMDWSATMVVIGGLICSCGIQIAGLVGWLVRSATIGWVCCWFRLQIAKYFLCFEEAIDQKCRA